MKEPLKGKQKDHQGFQSQYLGIPKILTLTIIISFNIDDQQRKVFRYFNLHLGNLKYLSFRGRAMFRKLFWMR